MPPNGRTVWLAKTYDRVCHLDEDQGCDKYSEDEVAEYFKADLRRIMTEPAPFCEQGNWCTDCYREVLNLAKKQGYHGGSNL